MTPPPGSHLALAGPVAAAVAAVGVHGADLVDGARHLPRLLLLLPSFLWLFSVPAQPDRSTARPGHPALAGRPARAWFPRAAAPFSVSPWPGGEGE